MRTYWDYYHPHLVAGGEKDGLIVHYTGSKYVEGKGYRYSIPGLRTFMPLYVKCGAMVPLTVEQANAIDEAREKMPRPLRNYYPEKGDDGGKEH